jgi:WD40 repeat protein
MSRAGRVWFVRVGAIALMACTDPISQTPTAVHLAFIVQPSDARAGVAINPDVAVAIQDRSGNLVTSATDVVSLTVDSNASGGSLAGTVSLSAVNGLATFSNLRIVTAGTGYTLKAASTGLTAATSTDFAIAAAAASRLAFTVQPSQTVRGVAITPPVQVAAQDSFGNLATEFRDSVMVALGGDPGVAVLSGTAVVGAVNGIATFNDLSIEQVKAEYTLIASAGALTSIASMPFNIAKPPVTLHVSTRTTGVSLDPDGYDVCVDPVPDDCMLSKAIGVNGDITMSLGPGNHAVELDGLAANCTMDATTTVEAADTTEVSFTISCVAAGTVRFTTATTGTDIAVTGYGFGVDGGNPGGSRYAWVPLNAVVTLTAVSAGPHMVTIMTAVPENCTVSGGRSHALNVPQDGTVDIAFDVRCVLAERIAFSHDGAIVVSRVDASDPQTIIRGLAPAWSPDGATLAYECDQDICTINPGGAAVGRLTADGSGNRHPTWSPDGSTIAFAATHAGVTSLYVAASNGSGGAQRLTQSVGFVGGPAWSPDGTRIAFDCSVDAGNDDICWINADGTGFARLTNDPARDYGAAWRPDGSTLAFATTRYGADEIVLMSASGGNVTRIGTGLPGFAPSWSSDGTQLAFVQLLQRDYDGDWYTTSVISTANADGSGVRTLTDGDQPAWKPHP